jgi:hypothetical protein
MHNVPEATRKVRKWVKQQGWKIKPLDPREWPDETFTNGGIMYKRKTVYIKGGFDDLKHFYVLLHEAGHILAMKAGLSNIPHTVAEKQAYFGGSMLAVTLGIKLNWHQWRMFNWEASFTHL